MGRPKGKGPDVIDYTGYKWLRSHDGAKALAVKLRKQGYYAFIERSGGGWQVYRSDKKR